MSELENDIQPIDPEIVSQPTEADEISEPQEIQTTEEEAVTVKVEEEINEEEVEEEEVEMTVKLEPDLPETGYEEEETLRRKKNIKGPAPVIDHRILAGKLTVYDWLGDLPESNCPPEIVEVRFKNTRKGFFSNPAGLQLKAGDIIAVETALGHDIGVISLAGELVKEQMRLKRVDLDRNPLKKVYRKAKPHDIEKWQQAIAQEHETMIRSRKIAADLKLNMKIGDVEYQGDKTKAIFYYIAEDRVDFRALIKVLAETFHIRIEMKQIGTRQEAGRIGGIGPCGLKLCCSTFITNFVSVSTSAARYQDISLNPQKLAGQCGKLKCCLNYEVDAYIDEQKDFPSTNIPLNTGEGMLYHFKTDIFGRSMYYSFDKEGKGILVRLPVKRIKEIISMNRKGIIPPKATEVQEDAPKDIKYTDGVGEESLNRFDEKRQKKRNSRNRNNDNNRPRNNNNNNNNNVNNGGGNNDGNRNPNNNNSNRQPNNNGGNNRPNRQPIRRNEQNPRPKPEKPNGPQPE